jgi:hypothetical protein
MDGGRGYGAACKNFQRRGNLGVADEAKKLRAAGILPWGSWPRPRSRTRLQKRKDPASAVVSVYYQLRAGTVARPDWVKNLADWFVMIPDGAVQYGWCLLRQASPDYVTARTFFLTAAQRGVPMYSYGVRLLYDGLNLLAERDAGDTEVAAAFRAVRRLAAVIDWRSAFTSLALTETDSAVTLSE